MKQVVLIAIALLLIFACSTSNKISTSNLAYLYQNNRSDLQPECMVYHFSDTLSNLILKIQTDELLYSKLENEEEFASKLRIHYVLYNSYESNEIVDSASAVIVDTEGRVTAKEIIAEIPFKAIRGNNYLMEIIATDVYRGQSITRFIDIDKTGYNHRQNFLIRSGDGITLFRNHFFDEEKLIIQYGKKGVKKIKVRYYQRDFHLPPPPFSIYNPKPFDFSADSMFSIALNDSSCAEFTLPGKGFYHFINDSADKRGLTLYYFGKHFPKMVTPDELIEPLRYLTSRKEYTGLNESEDKKEELDKFWLNIASNKERAKELIKTYYNRVQNANRFFSSHVEGWKTDRGMIYVIFGSPNAIYKSYNTENWTYGEESNYMSLTFVFVKVDNPFTSNDYMLNRTPVYKNHWYRGVDSWRQGRIFTGN